MSNPRAKVARGSLEPDVLARDGGSSEERRENSLKKGEEISGQECGAVRSLTEATPDADGLRATGGLVQNREMQAIEAAGLRVHLSPAAAPGAPLVVFLHGFGAPGTDLVPLGRALGLEGVSFAFPEAPLDLGPMFGFGRAWWRIDPMRLQQAMLTGVPWDLSTEHPPALPQVREQVVRMLDVLEERLRPSKLILGGFSQGAMLSTDVALHDARPLAGVVLLSGTLLAASEWTPRMKERANTPFFQSHGTQDMTLDYGGAEALRDALGDADVPLTFVDFAGGHEIPPRVLVALRTFLEQQLR